MAGEGALESDSASVCARVCMCVCMCMCMCMCATGASGDILLHIHILYDVWVFAAKRVVVR